MALKDSIIFTPYPESELETKFKQWIREVIQEGKAVAPLEQDQSVEKPVTIKEVCAYFGKSRQTIHAWMRQGIIPFHKVSRRTYFLLSEVKAAMIQSGSTYLHSK